MGFLIVIDGIDGTGKETQSKLLIKKLKEDYGIEKCHLISFPNYNSPNCEMIKAYLRGDFGKTPNEYAVISMYALDRWMSYVSEWKKYYDDGYIIIADRYVQSMLIYTARRSKNKELIDFINHLEFDLYKIPKPDIVFYLDMDKQLIEGRKNKITNNEDLDIIESDKNFMNGLRNVATTLSKENGWQLIDCMKNGELNSIENINNIILDRIMMALKDRWK